ncbi:MAG: ribosome maturation factor RimP [Rhodospirillales bacterium]
MVSAQQTEQRFRKTSEGLGAQVEDLIAPGLDALGYDIVRVRLSGEKRTKLQLMIERRDERAITVDDCAKASRTVEAILDVEDPIRTAYVLEVSSPGIDRPLTRFEDFARYAGHEARLEMNPLLVGRKRFAGTLEGVEGETIVITCEAERLVLPFDALVKAKLVLTDALIAEHQAAEADAEAQDEPVATATAPQEEG